MDKTKRKQNMPALRWRGIVEGFYYKMWTHSARMRHIAFLGEIGFNAYIYAPKDDPFHRERWREEYPQREMKKFRALVREASNNAVTFCWAISPGLSIRYSDEKDFSLLLGRLLRMADTGVRLFGVFLDDIPPQLSKEDQNFGSLARAQVELVNRVFHSLRSRLPDSEIIFCPTEYFGISPTPYLNTIGEGLDSEIGIFWTGLRVVSPEITREEAETIGGILKRKPILWDNYPVNDYNRNRLHLAPLMGRHPDLPSALSGYFANPMNEPEASRIPLATAADYLRNPHRYNPNISWRRAVRRFAPTCAADHFMHFADLMRPGFFPNEPKPQIVQKIARFNNAKNTQSKNRAAKKLLNEFTALRLLSDSLASKLKASPILLGEIRPYLRKLVLSASAGESAMKFLSAGEKKKEFCSKKTKKYLDPASKLPQQIASNAIEKFAENILITK